MEIPPGAGPRAVGRILAEAGVVVHAEHFAWYLRATRTAPRLRAGELRFHTAMTPAEVREVLVSGPFVTWPVTLPEGLRIEEMATRVDAAGFGPTERYVALAHDLAFIQACALGISPPPPTLEGLLLPETYSYRKGTSVEEILRTQVGGWKGLWDVRRVERARERGLSPYEITVLASVVEKETGRKEERPLISGVFHNRLKRGMRLESDPTIIYGLVGYDGNIRAADIRRPHPWNTYVIRGLPPTPIASPGVAAIDAVLWPEATEALFFVARGDGSHEFNARYEDHARAVRTFQGAR